MEQNTSPGTFGHGVIGAEAVAEERSRVERLERMLGRAGVDAIGLEHAQALYDAIIDRKGKVPEFVPRAGGGR